jgi:predicted transcriptional regulator
MMANAKSQVISMMGTLPDDASWDEIKYRVGLIAAVEQGLAAADAGDCLTHDDAKRKLNAWLQSSGLDQPSDKLSASSK